MRLDQSIMRGKGFELQQEMSKAMIFLKIYPLCSEQF